MTYRFAWLLVASHSFILACSSTTNEQSATEGGVTETGGASTSSGGGTASGGSSGAASGGTSGSENGGHQGTTGGVTGSGGHATGGSAGIHGTGGSVEDAAVEPDSGSGGSSGDAGMGVCSSCGVGSICVERQTVGGAFILADAGRCPDGRVPSSGPLPTCDLAPSFSCKKLPSQCTTAPGSAAIAHCTCARSLCDNATVCDDLSPTLMKCTLEVP